MEKANQFQAQVLIYIFLVVVAIIAFAALVKGWLRRTTFNSAREDWEDSPEAKQAAADIQTLGSPRLQEMVQLITMAQEKYELPWQVELVREIRAADVSMRDPFVPVWDHESFRAYSDAMRVVMRQGDRSLFNQAKSFRILRDTPGHPERRQNIRDAIVALSQTDQ